MVDCIQRIRLLIYISGTVIRKVGGSKSRESIIGGRREYENVKTIGILGADADVGALLVRRMIHFFVHDSSRTGTTDRAISMSFRRRETA